MKKFEQIDQEIEQQLKQLRSKGIEPLVLVLGHLSYSTLKDGAKELQIHISNEGFVLRKYKGLRVMQDPEFGGPGVYKKENESVEVLGR
jgi:hypothetical protein